MVIERCVIFAIYFYLLNMKLSRITLVFLLFFTIKPAFSQPNLDKNKQYVPLGIGFWNLENFYDTLNDPFKNDEEFLPGGTYDWTGTKYRNKLDHMSDVISQLGTESSPDGVAVIGVCEVENINVLKDLAKTPKLIKRNYIPILIEGPDLRGVDVGFMYNPKYFKPSSQKSFKVTLATDSTYPTRDELLVSGKLLGEDFHFIVCHWPSRRGGDIASEPNRVAAAKVARKIIDSLLKNDPNAKIILMGDLNDDPTNKSVKEVLNTTAKRDKAIAPVLYNAMEEYFKKGIGTLGWNDTWSLFDQQIMTPALMKGDFKDLQFYVSHIFNKPLVLDPEGKYKGYPLRTHSGGVYTNGYSDHCAVYSILLKEMAKK